MKDKLQVVEENISYLVSILTFVESTPSEYPSMRSEPRNALYYTSHTL